MEGAKSNHLEKIRFKCLINIMVHKNFFKKRSNKGKKCEIMCDDYEKKLTTLIWFDSLSTDVKVLDFAWGTQAN